MTNSNNARHKADERSRKTAQGLVRVEIWLPFNKVKDYRENAKKDVKRHLG